MNKDNETVHPLGGFSINVAGIKCFDELGSGTFLFKPITFIIGKNNSGKSTILDVLQECCMTEQSIFRGPIRRRGMSPFIEISKQAEEVTLKKFFPPTTSGGSIPGRSHWQYASESILPYKFTWIFDKNKDAKVKMDKVSKELVPDAIAQLANALKFPFLGLWSIRIKAEREVQPEKHNKNRELDSSGKGLTNLVRAFINSSDLPRNLVEEVLLYDLNKIYHGDSEFSAITCQEDENTGDWEIYLREEGKGDIQLSQSGSSLKTVFLVLAFLRLYPEVKRNGADSKLIFCLEEPENNLHPALLRRLIDFLAQEREKRGFSLVITTHSPICIDLATKREDATILHIKKENGRTVCENVLDYTGQTSILEDLDVRGSDILQANGIIWVEGPSDRIYVNKWIEVFSEGKFKEGVHYTMMFYGGKILSHFDALPPTELSRKIAMLAVNRNIAVIIDSDRRPHASKTAKGKSRKPRLQLNATKKEIINQIEKIGGFAWVTDGKEIENYIPKYTWNAALNRDIAIKDQFEDIPSMPEIKAFASTKVELAHKIEGLINIDSIMGNLDLEYCLQTLCSHIKRWNGLN
ncbi:MAG: ATP-binding protein [Paracoccaceae bacterium]